MNPDSPFAALGNVSDTEEVEAQVDAIVRRFAPGHDLARVDAAFSLLNRAFAGELPGYQKLQTLYHNRTHTNEVVLCTARMLHGMHLAGQGLDGDHIDAALIGALMHDVGYLMRDEEASGTGAQFTDSHVLRGVEFARRHLQDLPAGVLDVTAKVILLTDHRKHPDWVRLDNVQQQRAAYATATADLIGQMANREYLERVLFLYYEFEEAQLGGFRRHPRPAGKDHRLLPHHQGAAGPGPERPVGAPGAAFRAADRCRQELLPGVDRPQPRLPGARRRDRARPPAGTSAPRARGGATARPEGQEMMAGTARHGPAAGRES
jgi:hypothetical protein